MNKLKYYDILLSPIITEKSTFLASQSQYVFKVQKIANKINIKKAIEELFEVKVKKVNIIYKPEKKVQFKGVKGTKNGYKKALVTLQAGEKIEYEARIK